MSRLAARRRWVMTGPWPHPKTKILYYRKATPPDLYAVQSRLAELGVKVTREVQRSLETRDPKRAEKRYHQIAGEVQAQWDRWRDLLANGPQELSNRQEAALAAEHARSFFEAHEDNPDSAPPMVTTEAPKDDGGAWDRLVAAMSPEVLSDFERDLREYRRAKGDRKDRLSIRLVQKYPALGQALGPSMVASLEEEHGADADTAFAKHGLNASRQARRNVAVKMAFMMGEARRGLRRRQVDDYGSIKELEDAPRFEPTSPAPASGTPVGLSLFYLLEEKSRVKGRPSRHTRKDRGLLAKFVEHIGHEDALRVTKADVRGWRDAMMEEGLDPKTVNDRRLAVLRAVLNQGVKEHDLPSNVAIGIKDERTPRPKGRKEYSPDEAMAILKGTTSVRPVAGLSVPHKRAVFWVPWLLAYTGLRVTEITQFRGRNLMEEDGIPFLFITPEDGSTKGKGEGKAWTVGLHRHLVELGFVDMVRHIGDGPIFYDGRKDGLEITSRAIMVGRAQEAATKVSEWIKDKLHIEPPLGRPNHAWRHAHTSRCRSAGLDESTWKYMMGSGPKDARDGYGSWMPEVIDREINKLPRFQVEDLGWRPE